MRRRALLLAPLLSLAACGGGTGTGDGEIAVVDAQGAALAAPDAALIADAAAATTAQSTARVETLLTITPSAAGEQVTMAGDGIVDLVTGDIDLSMDIGALVASIDPAFTDWDEIHIRVIAGYAFIEFPATLTGESENLWIRFDSDDLGAGGQFLPTGGLPDGTQILDSLGEVAGGVVQGPTEQVDGVDVTRYDATIALADLAGTDLGDLGSAVPEAPLTSDVSVWIDGEARVRRIEATVVTPEVTVQSSVVYSDFGVAFDAAAPPDWISWDDAVGPADTTFQTVGSAI